MPSILTYLLDIPTNITDNKDGTYTVQYRPLEKGNHTIGITYENKNVANAPYTVVVDPSKSGMYTTKC